MSDTVKRSAVRTLLNTGTLETPVWSLLGDGVTNGKVAYNPKILEENYIHEDSATKQVESYAPSMAIEATAKAGDALFGWVDALRKARGVSATAETQILNVWYYDTYAYGFYYAEKQNVSVQVDDFGGEGGSAAKCNYTINYIGDPVLGVYHPATGDGFSQSFKELPLHLLTTLSLVNVTLTPLADSANLAKGSQLFTGVTTAASSAITATSTDPDVDDIEIWFKVTKYASGNSLTWDAGTNKVYIIVQDGAEEYYYFLQIEKS
jgi:hypothetical protein